MTCSNKVIIYVELKLRHSDAMTLIDVITILVRVARPPDEGRARSPAVTETCDRARTGASFLKIFHANVLCEREFGKQQ
jgi:hypothetical protein